jgi:hypothetical protein
MKLPDHVDHIRTLINNAFDNQFSRLGLRPAKMVDIEKIPQEFHLKREKLDVLINSHTGELGNYEVAREKALDELTFTLFNRLAAIKVMEAHQLFAPIVTKQAAHGGRSFGHKIWLEENPEMRREELEGLRQYFKDEFNKLGETIPLYHKSYPYALLPYVIDLNEIITAFNAVELDPQIEPEIWKSDDILGWLYESYNNAKKAEHKESKAKTEYDKVSLQSQVYTPRWVVEFLVNNSLGKLYLEMYPDSEIKDLYKIANASKTRVREVKPLHELKLIDPASGSGNFLLYAFTFFFALYKDQIDNYGANYDEDDFPKLIIENNLHGIDLDDRAIQLAQLGLWIKAKQKNRNIGALHFNVVSSDFYLPDFDFVYPIFKAGVTDTKQLSIIEEIWTDLQQAYKFGSLVKIEEKLSIKLHGLLDQKGITLFGEQDIIEYERFKENFFNNLELAISRFAKGQGSSFLTDKTKDAITFLKLITQKYDIATANPPYTDSGNFGPELKKFIDANYAKPYKFNTNLYATFIKRCFELTNEKGKVAMIHPFSFMFIKTFEDVRKLMIEKTYIETLVDWGLDRVNLFDGGYASAPTFYILSKKIIPEKSLFFQLVTGLQEKEKKATFFEALIDNINLIPNPRVYKLQQSELSKIKSWPFIYWISSDFRKKFGTNLLEEKNKAITGLMTGNNIKFLRFWWEVEKKDISTHYPKDRKKWVMYQKGGPYKKWYGNNWLVINYENNGSNLATTDNKEFYFSEGISYSALGKGSFRYISDKFAFDKGGSCIFSLDKEIDTEYLLGLLNSKLTNYIINCFNPTVNSQVGDFRRLPIPYPPKAIQELIIKLTNQNVFIQQILNGYSIFNEEFKNSPIEEHQDQELKKRIKKHLEIENFLNTKCLLNESIINEKVFEVYDLTDQDRTMVLAKEGKSIGSLQVSREAKTSFMKKLENPSDFTLSEYIRKLPEVVFSGSEQGDFIKNFPALYQSNNDLEDYCKYHQINPINVWHWFKESNVIPKQRMNDLAMEFLADILREILMEDEDGIIPLVPNAGEKVLLDRVEEKFMEKGFSRAQYSSFDTVLGRDLNEYISHHFFKEFSDHLNLFMYLPKTPFIWHLTSGPEQGFDCYLIIYKWSRDKLLSIRSVYIENIERALVNRQTDIRNKTTLSAAEQNEADKIYKQLKEIESFKAKIDELLEEGYNPILDDGVGKNIAPLQKKGMLAYEVLNAGQLKKYLSADW